MHCLYQKTELQQKTVLTRCPSDQLCLTYILNEGCDCHGGDGLPTAEQCRHLSQGTAERGFRLPALYNLQVLFGIFSTVRPQIEEIGMIWISVVPGLFIGCFV
jgi:hypothetical protein